MAIVCCDLINGIDWYSDANVPVWASGTTYAANALVKSATGSSLTSTTAKVWKSLQDNNINHALEEGAWWTLVADGSAAKPFKTTGDGTRGLTGGDECAVAKTEDTPLSGSYTFYDYRGTDANKGKVVVSGNNPDSLIVTDFIGNNEIGWWYVSLITYSAPNTIITLGGANYYDGWFMSATTAPVNATPEITYKANYVQISSDITCNSNGTQTSNLKITFGYDLATQVRDGYTVLRGYYSIFNESQDFVEVSFLKSFGTAQFGPRGKGTYYHDIYVSKSKMLATRAPTYADNVFIVGSNTIILYGVWYMDRCTLLHCTLDIYGGSRIRNSVLINKYANPLEVIAGGVFENSIIVSNNVYYQAYNIEGVYKNNAKLIIRNCQLEFGASWANQSGYIFIENMNGVASDNRIICYQGMIFSDSDVRHTDSGYAWRYQANNSASANRPLEILVDGHDIFEVAVSANKQVTAMIRCAKSSVDSNFEAMFICKGGQLAGIPNDVVAVAADIVDYDDWQLLTIQVTPTETGVLRFGFQVWGSATATCHIDDFGVSQ